MFSIMGPRICTIEPLRLASSMVPESQASQENAPAMPGMGSKAAPEVRTNADSGTYVRNVIARGTNAKHARSDCETIVLRMPPCHMTEYTKAMLSLRSTNAPVRGPRYGGLCR